MKHLRSSPWALPIEGAGETVGDYALRRYSAGVPVNIIWREVNELLAPYGRTVTWNAVWLKVFRSDRLPPAERIEKLALRVSPEPLSIQSERILVTHDWHVPAHDPEVVRVLFSVAEKYKVRDLLVAGDFVDFAALSQWPRTREPVSLREEIGAAQEILAHLCDRFERIFWVAGNHEDRLALAVAGRIGEMEELRQLFGAMEKVVVSDYQWCLVNGCWRVTHPGSYSRIAPQVERALAAKYGLNIIGTHGHLFGVSVDASGRYLVCQVGAMCDRRRMWWATRRDTTHPEWARGFVMLEGTRLRVFLAHERWADWPACSENPHD